MWKHLLRMMLRIFIDLKPRKRYGNFMIETSRRIGNVIRRLTLAACGLVVAFGGLGCAAQISTTTTSSSKVVLTETRVHEPRIGLRRQIEPNYGRAYSDMPVGL